MSSDEDSYARCHKVFKNDPLLFKSFVKEFVEVKTLCGRSFQGIVYTIDPVSESVVLLRGDGEKIGMDIVLGHSVASITVVPPPPNPHLRNIPDDSLFGLGEKFSEEEVELRRIKLKSWLCENRFPVVEDGKMLVLEDALVIHPPYGPDQCLSCNDTVLERVHKLISSMPLSRT